MQACKKKYASCFQQSLGNKVRDNFKTKQLVSKYLYIKVNWHSFRGNNSFISILPPFWKGVYSKRKEFAPLGSKFFPFWVDPFSEGAWCARKQAGSHKNDLPCQKMAKNLPSVSSPLKRLSCLGCLPADQVPEHFAQFRISQNKCMSLLIFRRHKANLQKHKEIPYTRPVALKGAT